MAVAAPIPRSKPFTAAIHELTACADAAALLDLEGNVLFTNDAWERFAQLEGCLGHAVVGARLLDGIHGKELRELLGLILELAAREPVAGTRAMSVERNGPDLARLVNVLISPVLAGNEPIGLTLVQRIVRELPASEIYEIVEGKAEDYRNQDGKLDQCSCCRRTRHPADPAEWDYVPSLVNAPPSEVVFSYCPLCNELHNPLGPFEEQ